MTARVWPFIAHVRSSRSFGPSVLIFAALLLSSQVAVAQSVFTQEGPKLVGTGAVGNLVQQGISVALSADGKTAIVGAWDDNGMTGAAWVFIRSNGVWTQQGSKLVAADAIGKAEQGISVALSGDGNTAIVGGILDNLNTGAAWVYTRSNGVWNPQGSKLVGNDAVLNAQQGWSVALSADGNTAMVGGNNDNSGTGAVWVYIRSGGVWTQQGSKLVGTGAVGAAQQGYSVALSANGDTAIEIGYFDNSEIGAAWVYTRRAGVWTQQGHKLVGKGAVGAARVQSVALSADGNTAIMGGPVDNSEAGAAWIYIRRSGVWTQQGSKLVGTGAVGAAQQGGSVALSADGNTAIVGGPGDDFLTVNNIGEGVGATWVFTRRNGVWTQHGSKLVGTGAVGQSVQGASVALSGDGHTTFVGGPGDNSNAGATWVFVERTEADCKNGGWLNFIGPPGPFTSQGQCVSYFAKLK
jgi:FG-GAP repeat